MISDLPGSAGGDLHRHALPVALCRRLPGGGLGSDHFGRGLHAPRAPALEGRTRPFQARMVRASGSFKDRGASVMLSILRLQGSTPCWRIPPATAGRRCDLRGGRGDARQDPRAGLHLPGQDRADAGGRRRDRADPRTRQATAEAAEAQAASIFYASHNWQAHFLQGTKTLAYELWEDLGFRAPDSVIIPCGAGSNVLGCDIGSASCSDRAPSTASAPLRGAAGPLRPPPCRLRGRFGGGAPVDPRPTLAEGASIAKPVRGREVLAALRRSGGGTVAVSEEAIEAALHALAAPASTSSRPAPWPRRRSTTSPQRRHPRRRDDRRGPDRHRHQATPRIADLLGVAS